MFESVNSVVSFVIFVGVAQSAQEIVVIVFDVVDIRCPFVLDGPVWPCPNLRAIPYGNASIKRVCVGSQSAYPQHPDICRWA
jgi:hypothetical protein